MAESTAKLPSAVSSGNLNEVLRLLELRADPNCLDEEGETPLFEATATGSLDIVAALLLHSADVSIKSNADMIALDLTTNIESETMFKLFRGAEIVPHTRLCALNKLNGTMRNQVASHLGLNLNGEHMMESGGPPRQVQLPESTDAIPLIAAASDGYTSEVKRLLSERADPNVADPILGETPLFEATINRRLDVMAYLLLHSADPTKRSYQGQVASDFADCDISRRLLKIFKEPEDLCDVVAFARQSLSKSCARAVVAHFQDRGEKKVNVDRNNDVVNVKNVDNACECEIVPTTLEPLIEQPPHTSLDDMSRMHGQPMQHGREDPKSEQSAQLADSALKGALTEEQERQALLDRMPSLHSASPQSAEDSTYQHMQQRFSAPVALGRTPSPAAAALIELFRTGTVESAEARRQLASLDMDTVSITLRASLSYLRQRGYDIQLMGKGTQQ